MKTRSTHIQQRVQQASTLKEKVVTLLSWKETEEFSQYNQFLYETGCQYLLAYIATDLMGIDYLQRSPIFWNWWRNQWSMRDLQFVTELQPNLSLGTRVLIYLELNNAVRLAQEIYPNSIILGDSYSKMYQDVIDNEIFKEEVK